MNERTAKSTGSVLRVFARWSETSSPAEITLEKLKDYLALRQNKNGTNDAVTRKGSKLKGSRAGARSTLSAIVSFLRHTGYMPAGRLDLPRRSTLEKRKLTHTLGEIEDMISRATEDNDKLALILGFRCGMREREIQHCTAEWFIEKRAVISIPDYDPATGFSTKDLDTREIPVFTDDIQFLKKMCKERPSGPLLRKTRRRGRPGGKIYNFDAPLRAHVKACGYPKFTIHSMRHSFATNMLLADFPMAKVAKWLGDEIKTVSSTYDHSTPKKGEADTAHRGERKGEKQQAQIDALSSGMDAIRAILEGKSTVAEKEQARKTARAFLPQFEELLADLRKGNSSSKKN